MAGLHHAHAIRSSNAFLLLVVSAAVFTDIFLYGVLVPVIPFALTARVHIPAGEVPRWNGILLALFNLGLCLGSPVIGLVADRVAARKLPFLFGLVTLASATVLLCLSRTIALFAVGRTLQGLSAAICWAVGLALVADAYGPARMGWAAGWVNWAMNAGFLLSPILGGLAYERAGYYSVYYMGFGLLACDIVLRLVMGGRRTTPTACGATASASEPMREVAVGEEVRNEGPTQLVWVVDKNHPLFTLVTSGRVLAALFGCMMLSASKYAVFAIVPLFVQEIFHWDSLDAGVVLLCVLLPGFLSPLVGTLADKYGTKWLSSSGFLLSIPIFVCLRFVTENNIRHKVLFGILLVLMGVALALSSTPLMAEITYVIQDKDRERPGVWGPKGVYGVAFGLFTTAFALGGVVGSFMAGYLYQGPGWATFGWAFAIWCAVGAFLCALFVGSTKRILL